MEIGISTYNNYLCFAKRYGLLNINEKMIRTSVKDNNLIKKKKMGIRSDLDTPNLDRLQYKRQRCQAVIIQSSLFAFDSNIRDSNYDGCW